MGSALDFIHTKNYLHRDVKPDNIHFDEYNNLYLADFGIAKVAADNRSVTEQMVHAKIGTVVGTIQCMGCVHRFGHR